MRRATAALLATLGALPAAAESPRFSFPLECRVGETCWIMQYYDRDAGPGWADYGCGKRSYDGHTGTDIAIRDLVQMAKGVDVIAAAAGVVAITRDGVPDRKPRDVKDPELGKTGCGNVVVLDHPDGWRTAYCHLRQGSVAVRDGENVARGQVLGQVGLSGLTEFPHLEFNVIKDGKTVDPFVGLGEAASCRLASGHLWDKAALGQVAYQPVDVRLLAFLPEAPDDAAMLQGVSPLDHVAPGRRPLFLTVQLLGTRTDDRLALKVRGPRGEIARHALTLSGDRILVTATMPLGDGPWLAGSYHAEVTVERGDWHRSWRGALQVAP